MAKQEKPHARREGVETRYEDVLRHVHAWIVGEYGSVAGFIADRDYRERFALGEFGAEVAHSYLSLPPEGEEKGVKSVPFLRKVVYGFTGQQMWSERAVQVTTRTYVSGALPALPTFPAFPT